MRWGDPGRCCLVALEVKASMPLGLNESGLGVGSFPSVTFLPGLDFISGTGVGGIDLADPTVLKEFLEVPPWVGGLRLGQPAEPRWKPMKAKLAR